MEKAAINRKATDAARDVADEKISAADRLNVSLTGIVSVQSAHRAEVERLTKEYEKQLGYSNESGITDEKRIEYQKKANALLEQRNATEATFQKQRAVLPPLQRHHLDRDDKRNTKHAEHNERIAAAEKKDHARADVDLGKADTAKNKATIQAEKERREGNSDRFFEDAGREGEDASR
jgi:hypothetical protein